MVKKLLSILILAPLSVLAVLFIIANRKLVTISLDPFNAASPAIGVEMPLFLALFGMLLLGIALGAIAMWQTQRRRQRRKAEKNQCVADRTKAGDELREALSSNAPMLPGAAGSTRTVGNG